MIEIKMVQTEKDMLDAKKYILKSKYQCIDIETRGLDPYVNDTKILTIAIGDSKKVFVFIINYKENVPKAKTLETIKLILMSCTKIVGHNLKYDIKWLQVWFDMKFSKEQLYFDTMLAHSLLNENSPHGLDHLTNIYIPEHSNYESDLMSTMEEKNNYESCPLPVLVDYNGMDVYATSRIYEIMEKELDKKENVHIKNIFFNYTIPNLLMLIKMESNGFHIDKEELERLAEVYENLREDREERIIKSEPEYFEENEKFNFNSYPQLRNFLYDYMSFPVLRKTKVNFKTGSGGNASVDLDTLEIFQKNATGKRKVIIDNLISRTKINSIIKSFLNVFKDRIEVSVDGRLRTNFNQHIVETGRLSSSSPNLQNIPTSGKLEDYGLEPIKTMFNATSKNGYIIQADYSQIELRTCAMYTKDSVFVKAFKEGRDLHGELAEIIYGDGYTKEQRTKAKRTNFSAIFDISAEALALELKITDKEAGKILHSFWSIHDDIKEWFDYIWNLAKKQGYIENYNGRRRRVKERIDNSQENWEVEKIKREVWNFPIQSSAAEISLTAVRMLHEEMQKRKMKSMIVGSVHDSVIVDAVRTEKDTIVKLIDYIFVTNMYKVYKWISVPIKVDISVGTDMHNLDEIKVK